MACERNKTQKNELKNKEARPAAENKRPGIFAGIFHLKSKNTCIFAGWCILNKQFSFSFSSAGRAYGC